MPSGKKKKRHKMSTHKRKKRLRKNKQKVIFSLNLDRNKEQTCEAMSFEFVLCLNARLNEQTH